MKKLYICLIIVLCSMKGFAQFSEYGGTYYDSQSGQTGVIVTYNTNPNLSNPGAQIDKQMAANAAAAASHIPVQPVIPPPTGGITPSTPPKPAAQPPTPKPDPCAEIQKAIADAKFKDMLSNLKDPKKLDLNNETGFYQDKDGNYKPMEVFEGDPGVYVPSGSGGYQNTNHVHMNQWVNPADGSINTVYPMPSPTDIADVYTDYHMVRSMGTDPGNNYSGVRNRLGYFQLRYTGQAANLSWEQLKAKADAIDTLGNYEIFKKLAKADGTKQIEAFLSFMRDTLKITDIELYQVDEKGSKKITLDSNNQIKETPCN